jgi:crotonobetainyl-CoA:carnitine CoA-transferase CaiB-like acyl-CoA transferase
VAISLFDEAQRARLRAMAGERTIAEWTATQEAQQLVDQLQAAGIAAGVLQDIEDLMERDEPLRSRGNLVDLPHPKLGAFGHVRTPMSFSLDGPEPFRAPGLGEHNAEVIREAAGLDAQALAQLESAGVLK